MSEQQKRLIERKISFMVPESLKLFWVLEPKLRRREGNIIIVTELLLSSLIRTSGRSDDSADTSCSNFLSQHLDQTLQPEEKDFPLVTLNSDVLTRFVRAR